MSADDYLSRSATSTRQTPQSEPIPGSSQVENHAGGFTFAVNDWVRLERFLILGSESGTYYVNERKLTRDNADVVARCIQADGLRTVQTIVDVSKGGRAAKNDPAIFALAMASKMGNEETRKAANDAVSDVCRIGTHLFHFATYIKLFGGWGEGTLRALRNWYQRNPQKIAYQAVKYRQRDGWSHRDLLRLSHPKPENKLQETLFGWIVNRETSLLKDWSSEATKEVLAIDEGGVLSIIEGYEKVNADGVTAPQAAALVREYNLPREAVPTDLLKSNEVWQAMLDTGMPMTALIRNLATMTRIGLLTPGSEATRTILDQLADGERLRKARVHPIQVLAAMATYKAGHSLRGSATWDPVVPIVDALDTAFYDSFDYIEPTGKRHLLALDCSGSMWGRWGMGSIGTFSAAEGAAAMAMVTARSESMYETVAFASGDWQRSGGSGRSFFYRENGINALPISPRQRLDDVQAAMRSQDWGGTDCALPMLYALDREREVDVFIIYTDSETWAGDIHPMQALNKYRQQSGIPAKLVVVGMTATDFSIADPDDAGSMDVVGFDTNAPAAMADFTRQ